MKDNQLESVFNKIRQYDYVVLRNFEEFENGKFQLPGHADIDILTNQREKIVHALGAFPRCNYWDGIHYTIQIGDMTSDLDIRTIGDGYYDKTWERDILVRKIEGPCGCFRPSPADYYYSLVYHAILQKENTPEDYLIRLSKLGSCIGIAAETEDEHLEALYKYMMNYKYCITEPFDLWVKLRRELISNTKVKREVKIVFRDLFIKFRTLGSYLKSIILK